MYKYFFVLFFFINIVDFQRRCGKVKHKLLPTHNRVGQNNIRGSSDCATLIDLTP